jgi:hypothetical protein
MNARQVLKGDHNGAEGGWKAAYTSQVCFLFVLGSTTDDYRRSVNPVDSCRRDIEPADQLEEKAGMSSFAKAATVERSLGSGPQRLRRTRARGGNTRILDIVPSNRDSHQNLWLERRVSLIRAAWSSSTRPGPRPT